MGELKYEPMTFGGRIKTQSGMEIFYLSLKSKRILKILFIDLFESQCYKEREEGRGKSFVCWLTF